MARIALGLEYDGSHFHGWQRQSFDSSVQIALETALSQLANEPIQTICAGRTDAGVHACGQVVHFDTQANRSNRAWVLGANTLLPPAIRVLWSKETSKDFNARRSATGRRYRYVIYNHPLRPSVLRDYVTWQYRQLDVQKMQMAAQYWIGEHDFSSFRASECQSLSPVRFVQAIQVVRRGDQVVFDITANAFLHHMVRNMVGTLVKIGSGLVEPEEADLVLKARDRRAAGITAPANGLYLVKVYYPQHYELPDDNEIGPWFLQMNEDISIK